MSDNRLDIAIQNFENPESELSLGERISELRDALTWAAFDRLKRIQKHGTKATISEEEEFKQIEGQKMFKQIEALYYSQLKQNKLLGKKDEEGMGKDFLKRIREQQGTMGSIVRNMNEKKVSNGD